MAKLTPQSSDAHWAHYAGLQLRGGVTAERTRQELARRGLEEARIAKVMGPAYHGSTPPELVDHAAIAAAPLTRRPETNPNVRRVATPKAQIYTWENLLSPEACNGVIGLIEKRLRASTTVDAFADPKIRTSESADLGLMGEAFIYKIDELIADALGIHWSYSDSTQAQKYSPGQEYKAHYDFFEPDTRDYQVHCQDRGQRTWTFMVYLNDVEAGGGTRFRRIEKTFMPKQGMAVIWNNLNPDGSVNRNTIHHGMKVRSGTKYIITKWFRERGFGPMFHRGGAGAARST